MEATTQTSILYHLEYKFSQFDWSHWTRHMKYRDLSSETEVIEHAKLLSASHSDGQPTPEFRVVKTTVISVTEVEPISI